jgi:hypothetical protein
MPPLDCSAVTAIVVSVAALLIALLVQQAPPPMSDPDPDLQLDACAAALSAMLQQTAPDDDVPCSDRLLYSFIDGRVVCTEHTHRYEGIHYTDWEDDDACLPNSPYYNQHVSYYEQYLEEAERADEEESPPEEALRRYPVGAHCFTRGGLGSDYAVHVIHVADIFPTNDSVAEQRCEFKCVCAPVPMPEIFCDERPGPRAASDFSRTDGVLDLICSAECDKARSEPAYPQRERYLRCGSECLMNMPNLAGRDLVHDLGWGTQTADAAGDD